jgi:hypothetical protein
MKAGQKWFVVSIGQKTLIADLVKVMVAAGGKQILNQNIWNHK